jgi:alkanesulfonate monooxygenase
MSSITAPNVPEISWLRALCDDNSAFLGGAESNIPASWEHCGDIVQTADRGGFDNVLLPSG